VINRRRFLMSAAGGAFAGLCLPKVGFGMRKVSAVGLQLYTVRKDLEKDFDGTIAKVAAIGFKEVEFAGYYNRTPEQIKAALTANGLKSPSAHSVLKPLTESLDKTVEASAAIGHRYLICSYLFPQERKSLDDYKRYVDVFNRAGEACKKAGIQFGYHNHDFEFVPMEGVVPFDLLLEKCDPNLVKIELDLYWITKAEQDPLKYFAAHPGRFPLFHVKDMDNTPRQFFTEVGRGTIDFKRIFANGKKAGVKHYFVEQDECPGPPLESAKVSFDYLKGLEF
jgi:sugar phosphate isomerase/epimerase